MGTLCNLFFNLPTRVDSYLKTTCCTASHRITDGTVAVPVAVPVVLRPVVLRVKLTGRSRNFSAVPVNLRVVAVVLQPVILRAVAVVLRQRPTATGTARSCTLSFSYSL